MSTWFVCDPLRYVSYEMKMRAFVENLSGISEISWDCFYFCLPSRTPTFDIKRGFVIQFEDFLFRKVKLMTTLDGVFMSVVNFDWLVLHEIMTREVRNVKKEQN